MFAFDGPAGSGPDPGKWIVWNHDVDVFPPLVGHFRDDRRNVFIDGNSNLVISATREGDDYFTGNVQAYTDTGAIVNVDGMGNDGDVSVTASATTIGGSTTFGASVGNQT